ncbi:hypothetical protein pb186bvf_004937 [Paramecium bursaria]
MIDLVFLNDSNLIDSGNEVTHIIRFFSIFNNLTDQNKQEAILIIFVIHLYLVTLLILLLQDLKRHLLVLKFTQYSILIYCSVFQVPLLSINFEFLVKNVCISALCEMDQSITSYIMCGVNIFCFFMIVLMQIFFCRSDKIVDDNFYNPLQISLFQKYTLKLYFILMVGMANLFDSNLIMFILVQAYLTFIYLESLKSVKLSYYYTCSLAMAITINICYYIGITIIQLMLVVSISIGLQIQLHEHNVCVLLTRHKQTNLNLASISHSLKYNSRETNQFSKYLVIANHDCSRCKNIHQICFCLLKRLKENNKQDKRINLLYSRQIARQKPIKSLINILKNLNGCDLYNKIAYEMIIDYLTTIVKKKQDNFDKNEQQELNTLNVNSIRKSIELSEKSLKQFQDIIQVQIGLWQGLMQGFQNMDEYIDQIKYLSKKMISAKKYVEDETKGDKLNVIQMRILQIYNTVIYLNPRYIIQFENDIEELLKIDRYRIDQNINNQILNEGRYIIVQTSLIQNQGHIIKFNKSQYIKFFNLQEDAIVNFKQIEDFMPEFIRPVHFNFLQNYVSKGYSSFDQYGINMYMMTPQNFLQNINLQINYDNSVNNDLILTAVISKYQILNKVILLSEMGQILGMDIGSYELIQSNIDNQNLSVQDFVSQGVWIQLLMRNVSKSIAQLIESVRRNGQNSQMSVTNVIDRWNVPQNLKYNIKYCHSIVTNEGKEQNMSSNENFDEDRYQLLQTFEDKLEQEGRHSAGTVVVYNLEYVCHKYKGGQLSYLKLIIIEDEGNMNLTKRETSSAAFLSKSKVRNFDDEESSEEFQVEQETFKVQNLQQLPNQSFKFFLPPSSPLNSTYKIGNIKLIQDDYLAPMSDDKIEENNENVEQVQNNNNNILKANEQVENLILTVRSQKQQLNKKSKHGFKTANLKKPQQEESSLHSQQSSYLKEYELIVAKMQNHKWIIKPLLKIALLFIITEIFTFIIMIVNIILIQNNINSQLNQISLLRQPQDITYSSSSLIIQYFFKLLYIQGVIDQSPLILYWNDVQLDYMNAQVYTILQPTAIQVPILAQDFQIQNFTENIFVENQKLQRSVPLSQVYQQNIQAFLFLYEKSQIKSYEMNSIKSKGVVRQNIVQLVQMHSRFIDQITGLITNSQLSVINSYILVMIIQLIVLIIIFSIQLLWWQEFDQIIVEFILILNRISFTQAELQMYKLQMVLSIIEDRSQRWMSSVIKDIILDFSKISKQNSIKQLISLLPQDYYFNKWNLLAYLILLIINIFFNVTGFLLYSTRNEIFQPSLLSMSNYVSFLHNFDSSFMYGGLIKLDNMVLGNDVSDFNQTEIILAFNTTTMRLQPQLNEFVNFIYGSSLASNPRFGELLYQNLCELTTSWLIMCNTKLINQTYWEQDQYSNLIQQGILGYTGQYVKYVTQEYNYEFTNLKYDPNYTSVNITTHQGLFQNFILQYFLDMQEIMRIFLKTFLNQNYIMGQDIITLIQGYFIGFGIFYILFTGFIYYQWVKYNQNQMILIRQIIGIIPAFQNNVPNYRAQVMKLYARLY